jgi:acetyl-CoA C-acetyltransferase
MCSQSDGACALILAEENTARRISRNPVWIRDHITVHREETFNIFGPAAGETTQHFAARHLFERNGITDPLHYFDVFEMYDPSAWWGLDWIREFFLLRGDEHLKLVEDRDIMIGGKIPINPSGGVIAANPIGATALLRVAEAALQIRGDAGRHQIPTPVRHALASGFGGTFWTVLFLLEKDLAGWGV